MSKRPDGTLRKQVRVRPGYLPPEEQKAYIPERVQRSKVPPGYVPGYTPIVQATAATKKSNQVKEEKSVVEDEHIDLEKQIKKLEKKLRQIEILEQKSELLPEESAKIATKGDLEKQLKQLKK